MGFPTVQASQTTNKAVDELRGTTPRARASALAEAGEQVGGLLARRAWRNIRGYPAKKAAGHPFATGGMSSCRTPEPGGRYFATGTAIVTMTSDLRDTFVLAAGDWLTITYRGPVRVNRRRIQRSDARSCAAARLRGLWTRDGTAIPTLLDPSPHPATKIRVRPSVTRSLTPPMVGQG